jgi:beta-lactamase class D
MKIIQFGAYLGGVDPYINVCKGTHSPRTWMKNSCLWYSRVLTKELGIKKFQEYVTKFNYGNMDLSGGLTESWISSSLKISPMEQITVSAKNYYKKTSFS